MGAGRAYDGVWLQQLENRWAEWDAADLKLEFICALVWNLAQPSVPRLQTSSAPRQAQTKDTTTKPVTAKLGTKACALINQRKCVAHADNPSDHHICAYCLNVAKRVCVHQERFCRRKKYDQVAKN